MVRFYRITDWEAAKSTFLWCQRHLTDARRHYTLEEHCTDHIEICQDMSQLYKHLSYVEPDDERKCKMHKRRADLLAEILNVLSPTHYLLICRQLMFEVITGVLWSSFLGSGLLCPFVSELFRSLLKLLLLCINSCINSQF